MEGSRYVDTPLFDLGKLFQSIVSNYEEWSILDTVIFNNNENNLLCVDKYFDFNKDKVGFITDVFSKILKVEDSNTISCLGIFIWQIILLDLYLLEYNSAKSTEYLL